ncbi:MAG: hypothetical protein IPN29_17305 [Saprospiraceae bacterium]|nr:hypothetical protein [Saprospiraceae bacterium]
MKVFNRSFLMVAVSFFVLYYCSVYSMESNFSVSFMGILFIQIFNEFELPSWLMIILGVVVLINLTKMVASRLFKIRNYNFMYIALVFLLTSCEELLGKLFVTVRIPSEEDWRQDCEYFSPVLAQYEVRFLSTEKTMSPNPQINVEGVNVSCKVFRWRRLPHSSVPDSCYWARDILTTLNGVTDADGELRLNFQIEFASVGDYFVLEGFLEKEGYSRSLFSSDERYYFWDDEHIPCNDKFLPQLRYVWIVKSLLPVNSSP